MTTLRTTWPVASFLGFVFLTNFAVGLYTLTVGKVLFDKTGSVLAFGSVLIAEHVLNLLLQGFAGALVDRGRPLRLLVFANLVRGLLTLSLAGLMLLLGEVSTETALFVFVGFAMCSPLFRSAYFVIPKMLAANDELVAFHGKLSAIYQIGQLAGVGTAGLLLNWSSEAAVMTTAVVFVVSPLCLLVVARGARSLASAASGGKSWWRELLARGVWFARNRFSVIPLLLACSVDFLTVGIINLVLVPLVTRDYGGQSVFLAAFDGAFAVGAIGGGLLVSRFPRLKRPLLAGAGMLASSVLLLGLGQSLGQLIHLAVFTGLGAVVSISGAAFSGEIQSRTPDHMAGTIAAFRFMLISVVSSAGIAAFSLLQQTSLMLAIQASTIAYVVFFVVVTLGSLAAQTYVQDKNLSTRRKAGS
jgi:DHA3 family macrolide efflux protein-like MFS transporter